jgi:hypothetical protein
MGIGDNELTFVTATGPTRFEATQHGPRPCQAASRRSHHGPDCLGRDSVAPDLAEPTYSPEDRATVDASSRGPLIDGAFRPHGYRNGTDVLSFANQVSDYRALVANLEILRSESD